MLEVEFCRSHVGSKPDAQTLPGADYIQDVANTLSDGVFSDIWFDAHAYKGEEAAENTISETQEAMSEAACILRIVADQASGSPAASNQLAVSKADDWTKLRGPTCERKSVVTGWWIEARVSSGSLRIITTKN